MSPTAGQAATPAAPRPSLAGRIGRTTVAVALGIISFGALAFAGLTISRAEASPPSLPGTTGPRPTPADGAIVVAVVLGRSGSDTADAFAPFEVFGSSPAFSVYTVADSLEPAPMEGGLSVVPSYTFDDVAAGTAPAPDVIVVPAVNSPAGPEEQAARDFVTRQFRDGGRVLGICAGSRLLAASGVLDGLRATSHWSRISALEASNPAVTWIRGQRYVQDGRVTTTGGVTSSIAGSLKVMADLAGAAEATRVGTLINYPGWSLDAPSAMPAQSFAVGDVPVLANAAFPWGRPTIDVQLEDGVGEIDAAAVFEVYSYSQAASATALSKTGEITTRHGLLVRTAAIGLPKREVVVPGSVTSRGGLHGFDAAFEQLSRTTGPTVVKSISKMLEYPIDRVVIDDAPVSARARPGVMTALGVLIALAAGAVPSIIRRARHR
ncbi:MAG TPA: DJ-1/PfpI family protein [Propionicimonas sp.]